MFNVATEFLGGNTPPTKKTPENPKRDIKPLVRCISLPHKNKSMEENYTVRAYFYFIYFYANQAMAGKFVVNSCAD